MKSIFGGTKLFLYMVLFFGLLVSCDDTSNLCDEEDCSGHGTCHWTSEDLIWCSCDSGYYRSQDKPTVCIRNDTNQNNTKPVIYLYPTKETDVSVGFEKPETVSLTYTYPIYPEEGWRVTAYPDGTLEDRATGKKYYSLYWEGIINEPEVPNNGSVVVAENIIPFLEKMLFQLGLNWAESNEFIIYWLPILGEHPYNFIHFLTETYDAAVPLAVEPIPDTVIRFSMRYYPLDKMPEQLPLLQQFTPPKREGFVLVEWGGREIPVPENRW
jgi:hypothetical protein